MSGRPAPTFRAIVLRELVRMAVCVVAALVSIAVMGYVAATLGGGWEP